MAQETTLTGGDGVDTLIGGTGNDLFVFDRLPSSTNRDYVSDFTHGTDRIMLEKAAFTVFAGNGTEIGTEKLALGNRAMTAEQRLIYDQTTGYLYYDEDGSGTDAATMVGVFSNKPGLNASDFGLY